MKRRPQSGPKAQPAHGSVVAIVMLIGATLSLSACFMVGYSTYLDAGEDNDAPSLPPSETGINEQDGPDDSDANEGVDAGMSSGDAGDADATVLLPDATADAMALDAKVMDANPTDANPRDANPTDANPMDAMLDAKAEAGSEAGMDAQLLDAGPPPDASRDAASDAAQDAGQPCVLEGGCTFSCTNPLECTYTCPANSSCAYTCGAGLSCNLACPATSDCDFFCEEASACSVTCKSGAFCRVRAGDTLQTSVTCEPPDAHCWKTCATGTTCDFSPKCMILANSCTMSASCNYKCPR